MKGRTRADPGLFNAKRRREIIAHARHVGAAETDDLGRWLIAWIWQNPGAKDQVWSVMEAARRMGATITEEEAEAIIEEARTTRKCRTADRMARWLQLTYDVRRALGITTIGSVNVDRRGRREIRRVRDKVAKACKRRALGARPQEQSLSRTEPWRAEGMSKRTWYRRRQKQDPSTARWSPLRSVSPLASLGTKSPTAVPFLSAGTVSSTVERKIAADEVVPIVSGFDYSALPVELRMVALGLPVGVAPLSMAA